MQYNGFSVDLESDGFVFESRNVWVMNLEDLETGEKLQLHPFRDSTYKAKFLNWLDRYECPDVAFHNGLGFDVFIMFFVMGMDYSVGPDSLMGKRVNFVDTFYLSMYLNPDREKHSIEYFGKLLGFPKMDFRQACIDAGVIPKAAPDGAQFLQYSTIMDEYCDIDADIGAQTYKHLLKEWEEVYKVFDGWPAAFKAGQKSFYLMSCQELTGWKFDKDAAIKLQVKIAEMMESIRATVEPQLPQRSLKKTEEKEYKMPAKPFKANGEYSSQWEKFVQKHNAKQVGDSWEFYGEIVEIESNKILNIRLPMVMSNQDQMKEWFLESGWKPTLFNYKRGPDGKPMRDPNTRQLIPTTPKIQEAGKLCPNLEKLEGVLVKDVVKWLSLRNRQSVLNGWLNSPRLEYDGRIGAGRTGIASTHRQKHKIVVNVPKADPKVLLGHEFRSLWIAEDGYLIAAGDAAAIEGRVQGHYCYKYDNGATAEELLKGDVHSKNACAFYGEIYKEVADMYAAPDFDKENPLWKPYRNKSKNGYYALMYGAAPPKVASTLGLPEKYGKKASDAFWEANPGTKNLKENLEKYWESTGKKKYLPAIDGRILMTRKKSALLNTIFQSCGGIVMDYAGCFMDKWLGGMYWDEKRRPYYIYKECIVRRIGYFHDELEYECEEPVAHEVSKMIEQSIASAGEFLKLKVPLVGEGKVGKNWKETH